MRTNIELHGIRELISQQVRYYLNQEKITTDPEELKWIRFWTREYVLREQKIEKQIHDNVYVLIRESDGKVVGAFADLAQAKQKAHDHGLGVTTWVDVDSTRCEAFRDEVAPVFTIVVVQK